MFKKWILVIVIICGSASVMHAQNDTITTTKIQGIAESGSNLSKLSLHNPTKAACWSLLPGGGQIYNKKYWKLPIVYAGLGVSGYLIYNFGSQANLYGKEIKARYFEQTSQFNPDLARYTDENLVGLRDYYLRNMEISIAACALIYLLNIVDAAVDAHLYYFDISDNLSMGVQPTLQAPLPNYGTSTTPAVSLVLKWK